MNREIKFRAWDITSKTMAYLGPYCYLKIFDDENLIISQFTGLRDKNGKEIYEGDIVRCFEDGLDDIADDGTIHQVRYCSQDDYPAFELDPWDGDCNGLSNYKAYGSIEVIGNIYENPELLEAK